MTEMQASGAGAKQRPPRVSPTAAAARSPQHEPTHAAARTRQRNVTGGVTQPNHDSYINFAAIPPDTSLEWKLFTAEGKEYPAYLQAMRGQGWEPVDPQEHPDWVKLPPNYAHHSVVVDGLILCERPKSLTNEARQESSELAYGAIKDAKARIGQTPEGTMTRQHTELSNRVTTEYMRPITVEE